MLRWTLLVPKSQTESAFKKGSIAEMEKSHSKRRCLLKKTQSDASNRTSHCDREYSSQKSQQPVGPSEHDLVRVKADNVE